MNKIKEEELKTIREQQSKLNSLVNQIGMIESQKHAMLHEIASVNKEIEATKDDLEKNYGAINIDLETGEYTVIEDTPEETPVAHV
tara:strand:+ start:171 stop:428 length:258 start_codon:yes stop_codon:yes gene_type:complete